MGTLLYVAPWVLGSVFIGVLVGFFLRRGHGKNADEGGIQTERHAMRKMLLELLKSAKDINTNVESHNTEIQENATHVLDMETTGEMESVKQKLLGHMSTLLESNASLQEDLVCTRYRIEEQAQEIDEARREARTDALTSVANRKACDEKLHITLDDFRRKDEPFVLMLIDLDHFKRINDAHGHPAGDRALKTVGHWLNQWVREGDFVGRYGGDEFVVLLPNADLHIGMERAETIRVKAAETASRISTRGVQIALSLSIGVVAAQPGDTPDTVLNRADQALYRSKQLGRNQVQCIKPEPTPEPTPIPVVNMDMGAMQPTEMA